MFESLRSLGLGIAEMRCPYGACSSTISGDVGWAVSSNVPVGKESRSGLMGWVVYAVWRGIHPHWRCGGVRRDLSCFLFGGYFVGLVVVDC